VLLKIFSHTFVELDLDTNQLNNKFKFFLFKKSTFLIFFRFFDWTAPKKSTFFIFQKSSHPPYSAGTETSNLVKSRKFT